MASSFVLPRTVAWAGPLVLTSGSGGRNSWERLRVTSLKDFHNVLPTQLVRTCCTLSDPCSHLPEPGKQVPGEDMVMGTSMCASVLWKLLTQGNAQPCPQGALSCRGIHSVSSLSGAFWRRHYMILNSHKTMQQAYLPVARPIPCLLHPAASAQRRTGQNQGPHKLLWLDSHKRRRSL